MSHEEGDPTRERNGRWRVNTHVNIGTVIQTLVLVVGGVWAVAQVSAQVSGLAGNLMTFEQAVRDDIQGIRADIREQAIRMDALQSEKVAKP